MHDFEAQHRRGGAWNPIRQPRPAACHDRPVISFIVPAHDESRLVAATLQSIHDAMLASDTSYEIVVVDDASTDDTPIIAERNGARVESVSFRHIAATRNAGAEAARGEILVFLDADTTLDATVVDAALASLRTGAVGGGAAVRLQGTPRWRERWLLHVLVHAFRLTRIAPGCFLFCTHTAFEACGGFDERYYAGEDVAISRALARQGRFAILREAVFTSDRKLRTFTLRDHLRLIMAFLLRGRRILHSREHLKLWYARRRHDPG